MMTRAEAKTKKCCLMRGKYYDGDKPYLCLAEDCPKWRDFIDNNDRPECMGEREMLKEKQETGENDPDRYYKCREKHGIDSCRKCPDAFGFCG